MLEQIGVVKKEADIRYWMVSAMERLALPNPAFIDLSVAANVKMQHAVFPDQPERPPVGQQPPAEQQQPSSEHPSNPDPSDSDLRTELELLRVEHTATRARVEMLESEQQNLRDLIRDLLDGRRQANTGPLPTAATDRADRTH
ncbi:Rad23 UV excision repair protein family [Striga asiatica]|uniref:Rad23 UV excision repair protein family n=1 Tax=Striga asiatica TaxID=4170 RepID=A0A5A7Q6D1_STRAF|nr:Rad23 UV excision repair protein family [Striga asiatica]